MIAQRSQPHASTPSRNRHFLPVEIARSFDEPGPRKPADEPELIAQVRLPRGRLRFTSAGLTLTRPGGGWLLGAARLRYVALRRVRFVFWFWLGGLLTCYCLIMLQQDAIKPLPGWGGLLLGGGLLAYGLRGASLLSVHLLDAPEPFACFLHGADENALRRFEDDTNEYLRALAEQRRLRAEAEEAARAAAEIASREAGGQPPLPGTTAVGGVTFRLGPPPVPPVPPSPYPPSLLPGILP